MKTFGLRQMNAGKERASAAGQTSSQAAGSTRSCFAVVDGGHLAPPKCPSEVAPILQALSSPRLLAFT